MKYILRVGIANILWLLPVSRLFALRRFLLKICGFEVGLKASVCGGYFYGRGDLVIGASTWLSPNIIFYTHPDAPITLGENCDIGPGVEFIPGGHMIGKANRRAGEGTAKPIEIGDGCWIGAKSVILGGVRIGAGCVIAAGSVVTQDMPDNVLAAGVPARIKRVLGEQD